MALKGTKLLPIFILLTVGSCYGLQCYYAGVFAHPDDCTRMYTCQNQGNAGFILQEHQCPPGTAVDTLTLRCVDASLVPGCPFTEKASDPICESQLIHCTNCTHIVSCTFSNGQFIDPVVDSCGEDLSGNPLYCDAATKKCVPDLPEGCSVPGFQCTSAGYFPDLRNCDLYHVCYVDRLDFRYETKSCNDSLKPKYNSQEFRCSPNSNCTPVICTNIGVQEYEPDDRYFVFCSATGPQLYACPGNLRVDKTTVDCKFTCQNTGLFADINDCYSFIRCENDGSGGFITTPEICELGLAFNPISGACEDAGNVKCPPVIQYHSLA